MPAQNKIHMNYNKNILGIGFTNKIPTVEKSAKFEIKKENQNNYMVNFFYFFWRANQFAWIYSFMVQSKDVYLCTHTHVGFIAHNLCIIGRNADCVCRSCMALLDFQCEDGTRSRDFDILLISIQTAETVHLLYSGAKKIRQ